MNVFPSSVYEMREYQMNSVFSELTFTTLETAWYKKNSSSSKSEHMASDSRNQKEFTVDLASSDQFGVPLDTR